jgi:hypothetical protein
MNQRHCARARRADDEVMKRVLAIGPWLMELINPPPRETLSVVQKIWRVLLVTVTIVTLCIIAALAGALLCVAWQRSREFFEGAPEVRSDLAILLASALVNVACVFTLLQIKKLDRKLIPPPRDPAVAPPTKPRSLR